MLWPWPWRPPFVYHSVLVNLKSNPHEGLQGVVWGTRGPWITLRKAALAKANGDTQPMDGDVVIHRDNIAFVQVFDGDHP